MWPFSRTSRPTEEQLAKIYRRCGISVGTLEHCLAANAAHPGVCKSLETQVVHCHAEVVCPELAAEHTKCFQRVVNSKGKEPYSACEKHVDAMKRHLRKAGLYPFKPAVRPSSSRLGGPGGASGSGSGSSGSSGSGKPKA